MARSVLDTDLALPIEDAVITVTHKNRFALYAGLNIAFLLVVITASVVGGSQNPRLLYLILMFALCTSSVIDLDGLNGRYSLLGMFMLVYFVMFGLGDLNALMQGPPTETSRAALSATEAVILLGGLMAAAGYRSVVSMMATTTAAPTRRDWPKQAILVMGCLLWTIGTFAIYHWYVHIVTDTTNEAFRKGVQSRGTYVISAYILAQMMQPLGVLLIAYAWRTYRSAVLLALVVAAVVLQVALGFIIDQKGMAMMGGALVILTCVLLEGRIPKLWVAGAFAYVLFVYPIFVAARVEIHGTRGIARTAIVENFGKVLELAIASKSRDLSGPNREMTFLERLSLRNSVEIFVTKTGRDVPFQRGYTLTPLLATFIPKIIWSDKPDVPTGQLFNKDFHVTDSDDIFLSPSHLGELYWNFGFPGVLGGMAIIGAILGFTGARFNLAEGRTITRLFVTVVTIKELIVGFEGDVASIYVVWLRSMAGVGVLHLIFARLPVGPLLERRIVRHEFALTTESVRLKAFPNLLS
jgi:hypothetical protein